MKRNKIFDLGFITLGYAARVSDPCYDDNDAGCSTIVDNLYAGGFCGFIEVGKDSGLVSSIYAVSDSCGAFPSLHRFEWEHVTNCPVDSGQLGIFDNSFFERSSRGEHDDPDSFYGECCGITLADEPYGPLMNGYGIVTGGFGGDGVYPLYVARDERSRVVAIKVDFGND